STEIGQTISSASMRHVTSPVAHPLSLSAGRKRMTITENQGSALSPLPVAPVQATERALLPDGLQTLQRVATLTDLGQARTSLTRDAEYETIPDQTTNYPVSRPPRRKESRRHHKRTTRKRTRTYNTITHALRTHVEWSSTDTSAVHPGHAQEGGR